MAVGPDLASAKPQEAAPALRKGLRGKGTLVMHLDNRSRASLSLVGGILGMVAQERLSLIPNDLAAWGALATLGISLGLLVFSQRASFRAGYEQARREARVRIATAEAG
jgi:hypothetical protein